MIKIDLLAAIQDKKPLHKLLNRMVHNQVSRGRIVTRKASENCELDNDTRFTE